MLYTIANDQWTAEKALTPAQARAGLFRTRDEAVKAAEGLPTLAVAVRYDETRGTVVAVPPASLRLHEGDWSAPAFVNESGGIVPLCPIPPALVKRVGPPRFRVHSPESSAVPTPGYAIPDQFRFPIVRSIVGRILPGR